MSTIVAAVDYSEFTPVVVSKAASLASALKAKLEILHIVAPEPAFVGYSAYAYPGRDERAEELKKEKKLLKETVEGMREYGIEVSAYMKEAPVADGILKFAEKHSAELIVMGTHGKGMLKTALMGSASQDVIQNTRIPVLLIPRDQSDDGA